MENCFDVLIVGGGAVGCAIARELSRSRLSIALLEKESDVACGTSGRLGIMDAAECGPTYGIGYEDIICLMAGGHEAVFRAQEDKEDLPELGEKALKDFGLTPLDTVVAAAASGRTPYCIGALDYARSIGALAVSISRSSMLWVLRPAAMSSAWVRMFSILASSRMPYF